MPAHSNVPACNFRGPALYPPSGPMKEEFRDMLKFRIANQNGSEPGAQPPRMRIEYWNEVVLDDHVMIPSLVKDTMSVDMGFVYVDNGNKMQTEIFEKFAITWVSNFQAAHQLASPPPLLRWDATVDVRKAGAQPFAVPDSQSMVV